MSEEDRFENQDEEGHRSLWAMLQGPVRGSVRTWSLAEFQTLDGFLNLLRVGKLGFAYRGQEVRPQSDVNNLNNCRDRRIGYRLKLSLQIVGRASAFSESEEAIPPGVTRGKTE